jgi:hypothetical protein
MKHRAVCTACDWTGDAKLLNAAARDAGEHRDETGHSAKVERAAATDGGVDQSDGEVDRRVGVNCRDCPYQDIWHPVRTTRETCKHDMVTGHNVEYVDPGQIRRSVDADGNVVIVHDEQRELVTDGGHRPPCEAVAHMDPTPPSGFDALERRACPNCRLYFDVGAGSDAVFCSDACRCRHERGELIADGGRDRSGDGISQDEIVIARKIVDLCDTLEENDVDPEAVMMGLDLAHDIKATENLSPLVIAPISRDVLDISGCDND